MTRAAYVERARALFEALAALSLEAADEARQQAGLPEVWCWTSMSTTDALRLSVACQLRLL